MKDPGKRRTNGRAVDHLGPYRILRKLGRGGMGTVYEGVNRETGEPAAIKVLSAALADDEGFRERFDAEIETLRKLNHPNIVRLFGFGREDERLFYAMELVDGTSLEDELRHGRRFEWREVTRIGIEMCRALRHAHDRGVVHRDIKPANLLLDREGSLKLSDFGIARLFGNARLTAVGNVLGTAEYMSPEQAAGKPVGPKTDLYSLGGVLYALLAGRPPFRAKALTELLQMQQHTPPEPVSQYAEDVPTELERIIAELLAKDPGQRVANASVLGRRLEAMQRALSVDPQLKETVVDEQAVGEAPDFDVSDPRLAAGAADATPASQAGEAKQASEAPGSAAGPPEAMEGSALPVTRPTSAFQNLPQASAPPKGQPVEEDAEKAEAREAETASHFTPVRAGEPEPFETEKKQRHVLISAHTWALMIALVTVGLSAWYLLQPPSADKLYARISEKVADESVDSLLDAEDDIKTFLDLYSDDSRCRELRLYHREIDLYRLERKFERRARGLASTESLLPVERSYLEAINYLKLDPEKGMAKLRAIVDFYGPDAEPSGSAGQCVELARRRLEELNERFDRYKQSHFGMLQQRLKKARQKVETEPETARKMWQGVIELYEDKPWAEEAVREARDALNDLDAGVLPGDNQAEDEAPDEAPGTEAHRE